MNIVVNTHFALSLSHYVKTATEARFRLKNIILYIYISIIINQKTRVVFFLPLLFMYIVYLHYL